jgi:large subunit ribosomal protein L11
MIKKIKLLVEGGKAAPDASSGPQLAALKVNVDEIFKTINQKTKEYEGLQVPVIIEIDTETKNYEIKVGIPPVSSLIKKELGIEKAKITEEEKEKGVTSVGDLKFDQIVKIAKLKLEQLETRELKEAIKQVIGTCVSMQGILIEGRNPKEILKEVEEGKWDEFIK